MQIAPGKSYFKYNDRKIHVFADVPHLLKLLRNHFLDQGFILPSGKRFVKKDLIDILQDDKDEFRMCHKLKLKHFNCSGPERMRVVLAAQLFSHSVATAVKVLAEASRVMSKEEKERYYEISEFIELINNSFDIMNSRTKEGHKKWDFGFGCKDFDGQKDILLKARNAIKNLLVIGRKDMIQFQKGYLISIDSTFGLLEDNTNKLRS